VESNQWHLDPPTWECPRGSLQMRSGGGSVSSRQASGPKDADPRYSLLGYLAPSALAMKVNLRRNRIHVHDSLKESSQSRFISSSSHSIPKWKRFSSSPCPVILSHQCFDYPCLGPKFGQFPSSASFPSAPCIDEQGLLIPSSPCQDLLLRPSLPDWMQTEGFQI